jgi:hypothetical protein
LSQSQAFAEESRQALAVTAREVASLLAQTHTLVADWRGVTERWAQSSVEDTRALREAVTGSVSSSVTAIGELRERLAADAARSLEGLATLRDELARSAMTAAERLGEVQRQVGEGTTQAAQSLDEVRREIAEAAKTAATTLVAMHGELARGTSAAVEDSQRLRGDLVAVVETVSSTWAELRTQVAEATRAAGELTAKGLGEHVEVATAALRDALGEAGLHWGEIQQAIAAHAASWQGSTQEFRGFAEAVLETARAEAARVAGLTEVAAASIKEVVHDRGQDLGTASAQLTQAAEQLGQGMRLLTPSLSAFVTETQRLSQEVALLATRGAVEESGGSSELVLDELQRLGEGFERLAELVRLASVPVEKPSAEQVAAVEADAAAGEQAAREAVAREAAAAVSEVASGESDPVASSPSEAVEEADAGAVEASQPTVAVESPLAAAPEATPELVVEPAPAARGRGGKGRNRNRTSTPEPEGEAPPHQPAEEPHGEGAREGAGDAIVANAADEPSARGERSEGVAGSEPSDDADRAAELADGAGDGQGEQG